MSTIKKMVEIAKNEIGYLEKKNKNNLDSKQTNAGNGNYTKYARDLDSIKDFYNGKKQGYAWCDVFVDWCFVKTFGIDRAKTLLCQPNKSLGAGVSFSKNYYVKKKQYFKSNPKIGDQIFFKQGIKITHTGLVYNVDSNYVYTIEGNTSNGSSVVSNGGQVCSKKYKLNSSCIDGYGRPNYSIQEINGLTTNPTISIKKPVIKYVYNCDILNVRKGPNISFPIVRVVVKGKEVKTYETKGNWTRIGNNEWVYSKYLSLTKPKVFSIKKVFNCHLLNIRNKPSLKGKVIGTLKTGSIVNVYSTNGAWSKIALNEEKYVYSSYLR